MHDLDIRQHFRLKVTAKHADNPRILVLEELGLAHGSTKADLVVIDDYLHGYEFKADNDNLQRLPEQIRLYSAVMNYVTLIVGYRHALNAMNMVPSWWGVKLASIDSKGNISLSDARAAYKNRSIDKFQLAKLLWRTEALDILEEYGEATGVRTKPRVFLYRRLAEILKEADLRSHVRRCLSSRSSRSTGVLQMSNGD